MFFSVRYFVVQEFLHSQCVRWIDYLIMVYGSCAYGAPFVSKLIFCCRLSYRWIYCVKGLIPLFSVLFYSLFLVKIDLLLVLLIDIQSLVCLNFCIISASYSITYLLHSIT